jgi:oligopeptide/dipeptide ABC transporter ATP-binding protein
VTALLEVRDLRVEYDLDGGGEVHAVRGIDFIVERGSTLGLVGESGCGKTAPMLAVMGLLPATARVSGSVLLDGNEILTGARGWRGRDIAMVFQDSMSSLNPLMRVGRQIAEVLHYRGGEPWKQAQAHAIEHLARVGITAPERVARQYPYELSGGMRQRVMIASALAGGPRLLIADEATTGLDVTVQAQIIALLHQLRAELGLAVVFVSHDLGAVAELCDNVAVVYGGRIAESGPTEAVVHDPQHPYTQGLLSSFPRFGARTERLRGIAGAPPRLDNDDLGCSFRSRCAFATTECASTIVTAHLGDRDVACIRVGALR